LVNVDQRLFRNSIKVQLQIGPGAALSSVQCELEGCMPRTLSTLVAAAAGLGVAGCASTSLGSRPAAAALPPRELALEVARGGMSEETYRSMILALSQSFQKSAEKWAAAEGRKLPASSTTFIAELLGEEIPYEMVGNITANFYLRHYTEAELKELAAFQRTAVYEKQTRLMLTLINEAGQEIQQMVLAHRSEIEAKVKARLGVAPKTP
jgi:hypothetical protein